MMHFQFALKFIALWAAILVTEVGAASETCVNEDMVMSLAERVASMETTLTSMRKERADDKQEIRRQAQVIADQNHRLASFQSALDDLASANRSTSKRLIEGDLLSNRYAAFSAYLDHDLDGFSNGMTITFNQPLYNTGNYNTGTGVFTCPMRGVYLFIYFIGNRNAGEIDANLVVNGVKQNEAVAEGTTVAHDTQGGNAAILHLKANDQVWVATTLGNHVEGQWRFSSFSGALLYPDLQ